MRRLWVRWTLLVVFVAILGTVFVSLGQWQLDRLQERKDRNATTVANERAPILPAPEVFTKPITDADQWRRVEARGTFDGNNQFLIRTRRVRVRWNMAIGWESGCSRSYRRRAGISAARRQRIRGRRVHNPRAQD